MARLMDIVIPRLDFLESVTFWVVLHSVLWYEPITRTRQQLGAAVRIPMFAES